MLQYPSQALETQITVAPKGNTATAQREILAMGKTTTIFMAILVIATNCSAMPWSRDDAQTVARYDIHRSTFTHIESTGGAT